MASGKLGLRLRLTKTTAAATDRQSSEVVTISPALLWLGVSPYDLRDVGRVVSRAAGVEL